MTDTSYVDEVQDLLLIDTHGKVFEDPRLKDVPMSKLQCFCHSARIQTDSCGLAIQHRLFQQAARLLLGN